MEPVINLNNIVKRYQMGDVVVEALREVSLTVQHGEFAAIMGTSGSGKSTLMNVIGCLDVPTSGEYTLQKQKTRSLNKDQLAKLRNLYIGFVFQNFNLIPRTTALENVELPAHYRKGVNRKQAREKAVAALEQMGLADRMDHIPSQLSGGQQQRVAIARALVNDPEIILADEPTGALDSRTSIEVMDVFQQLNALGKTIILVTHEPDIAEYASRVIRMRDGKINSDEPVQYPRRASEDLQLQKEREP